MSEDKNKIKKAIVSTGIEEIKNRFGLANSDKEKIAILKNALLYGEAGEDWLFDLVATEKDKIKWIAAALLSHTDNEIYKELLGDFFAKFIRENPEKNNAWRQEISDIYLDLKGIKFKRCELHQINFNKTNLSYAKFDRTLLYRVSSIEVNFRNATFEETEFIDPNFQESYFGGANLIGGSFLWGAEFKKVNFINANLKGNKFRSALIEEAIFKNTNLDDTSFTDSDFKQILFDNCNCQYTSFSSGKLTQIVFRNCKLNNANFSYCQNSPVQIVFSKSDLENADFRFSDLREVTFDNVNLKGADFRWCDLTGVDFTGLDVRGANFTRCTFGNNNLDKANTEGAKFNNQYNEKYPLNLKWQNLKGALFDDRYYYEPGYE